MQAIEFQLKNSAGLKLHFQHWPVEGAKAVVALVHGLGEYIGRYGHVAAFFSQHDVATMGFDHQGHGRSAGKRGHSLGMPSMLDDVTVLLDTIAKEYPGLPVFLYGHSMGGCIVLNHLLIKKPSIAGLIATAPLIRFPEPPPRLKVFFGRLMSHLWPSLTLPNGLDVNGLSNDEAVIAAYKNDPLVHDRISAKLGTDLIDGAAFLDNYAGTLACPTLLMHGEKDPITSPTGTAAFAKRNKGEVTYRQWDGLKHEIHNEPQQAEVLAFLVEWMGRFL